MTEFHVGYVGKRRDGKRAHCIETSTCAAQWATPHITKTFWTTLNGKYAKHGPDSICDIIGPWKEPEPDPPPVDWSKPLQTTEGVPATLVYTDEHNYVIYRRLLVIHSTIEGDKSGWFEEDGKHSLSRYNIVNVPEPEPQRLVRYFNMYPGCVGFVYDCRKDADNEAVEGRIACKRVEFTAGEWDD